MRPGGRMLVLEEHKEQPVMLTEFGGIALSDSESSWGYSRASDGRELAERYRALLRTVRSLDMLAGFCYTQFTDTYQETSGLLYADRTPKFSLEEIASATIGRGPAPSAGPRGPLETDGAGRGSDPRP